MKVLIAVSLIFSLSACASQQIRCDGTLRPINPPAVPAEKPAALKRPAAPVEKKVGRNP